MLVDFHYHLAQAANACDELIADMDRSGVEATNLFGGPADAFWEYRNCRFASNEAVLEAVRKYPGRLVGSVFLDPRDEGCLDTFKRYIDLGFRGVKMFPASGYYPDEERFFPLYERIESAGVPVLFHAGQTNIKAISADPAVRKATSSKYGMPMNFDGLARLFPKLTIVLAHMGYPDYINAWSVAHANPNVYMDISGSGPWTEAIALFYNAVGGHNFIPIDFSRVLWGTDNCLQQSEHRARSDVYLRQMGATSADRKLVFGETAKRLLKLGV